MTAFPDLAKLRSLSETVGRFKGTPYAQYARDVLAVLDRLEAVEAALREFQRVDIAAYGHAVGAEWMTQGEHLWELSRPFRERVDALLGAEP